MFKRFLVFTGLLCLVQQGFAFYETAVDRELNYFRSPFGTQRSPGLRAVWESAQFGTQRSLGVGAVWNSALRISCARPLQTILTPRLSYLKTI